MRARKLDAKKFLSDRRRAGMLRFAAAVAEVRSIHWSPYDRVRVVNAIPEGLFPAPLDAHTTVSIPALDAFQRQLTPLNSTPTFACMERP
jgi:hypothetical protein